MKRILILGMIVLSCIFTGCPVESEDSELQGSITIELPEGVNPAYVMVGMPLTARYSGSETVNYQWDRDGSAYTGVLPSNTLITNDAGQYTVTVSASGYKSKTSSPVTVRTEFSSMTFVDNPANIGRSFTIYEDLGFRVELFDAYFLGLYEEDDDVSYEEFLEGMSQLGLVPGLVVTGIVIESTNTWTDDVITGSVDLLAMEATDETLKTILAAVGGGEIDIAMTYTKEEGEISKVTVEFLEGNDFTDAANGLMGGDYLLLTE